MATLAELSVIIGANITDLEKKLNTVQSKLGETGAKMKDVGKTMSLSLTAPIVLFGASTLKAAGDFEAGMNNVQALTGATGDAFAQLTDQAKELGATTQFSASEAADGMGFLAQAGFDANKILGAMPGTLNLAAAASLGLGESADIVSNIMSGFNLEAEDLDGAVDLLTKQFTTSNTNLTQLGEAMKFVGPVASSLGISMAETAAAIGALSDAGMQGSMAGTGFRKILSTLILKGKDLGLKIKDASGKMLPFVDVLEQMEKQGITTETVMETFGERGGPALLNLLTKGSRGIREQTALLAKAGGTADDIAKTKMKGLNGAMKALASAFEGVQLAIADSGILEFFTDFASGIANTLREIAKTNPGMLKMGVIIAGVVAAAGPLIFILGTMATAAAAISAPVLLVAGGLAALAIGIGAAATSGERSVEAFEQQRKKVIDLASSLNPLLDRHDELKKKTNLSTEEQEELKEIIEKIAKAVPGATTAIDEYGNTIGISTEAAKKFIQQQKDILALNNAEAIEEQADAVEDLVKRQNSLFKGLKNVNGEWFNNTTVISKTGKIITDNTKADILSIQKKLQLKQALQGEIETREAIIAGLKGEKTEVEKVIDADKDLVDNIEEVITANETLNESLSLTTLLMQKQAEGTGELIPTKDITAAAIGMTKLAELAPIMGDAIVESNDRAGESFQKLSVAAATAVDFLQEALPAAIAAMGEALGEALVGGDPSEIFKAFVKTMLEQLKNLGTVLIATGTALLFAGVTTAEGIRQIAAGTGLITAATAGIALFADGAIISGPVLGMVGEGRGTSSSNPEIIAPLDKLKGMLPQGGGGGMGGIVEFVLDGTVIRGVLRNVGIDSQFISPTTNFGA